MHADTAASLAVSLVRGLQQVVVCQLSKWVWDKNAGADTAVEYVNRGVHYREVKRDNVRKQPQMQVSKSHLRLG